MKKRAEYFVSERQRSFGFFLGGFFWVAWIAKSPGVFGKFRRSSEQRFECRIDRGACFPDFDKIMGLAIDRPCQVRNPFIAFSAACCAWNTMSEVKGGTAPSSNVPARKSFPAFENQARVSATRAGSCGMEQFAFPHDGGG